MWRDAAACGVFAFDWSTSTDRYELRARPVTPIAVEALPTALRALCLMQLPTVFGMGAVAPDVIRSASQR
jgi:hypothetical protein